ncbi:hypothetical protein VN0889_05600 [Helicobacter pylori]
MEKGGSFSPSDRAKFARVAREHGIEDAIIEKVIDIAQTISLIHRHEDGLMGAIWQERRRKPCALNSKKALMKI